MSDSSSTGAASADPLPPFSLQHVRSVFLLVESVTGIFFCLVWWNVPSHLIARLVSKLYGWSVQRGHARPCFRENGGE